jgi:EAL domain-containing protein (putative c-di-GMP-specific phosphodiesterase class I)
MEYIEVNLSVRQCESATLADRYLAIMGKYHVSPSMINLEVTESASIRVKNVMMKNMDKLIEHGVSFSLDDFGNGESNLNYIVDMPVDIVKFDRDMTRSYFETKKGKLVMETVTGMIPNLGLKIVSEGVETEEQLDAMKQLGVHYIQGYYFSKPLPQDEFVSFVKEHLKKKEQEEKDGLSTGQQEEVTDRIKEEERQEPIRQEGQVKPMNIVGKIRKMPVENIV